jgi:hypothetical protein
VLKRTVERIHEAAQPLSAVTGPVSAVTTEAAGRPAARSQQRRKGKSRRGGSIEARQEHRAAMVAEAMTILAAEPGVGPTALAERLDCPVSTAQRILWDPRAREPVI